MQQRYKEKLPKIEILYKQSMDGALQDVKKAIGGNRLSARSEPCFL